VLSSLSTSEEKQAEKLRSLMQRENNELTINQEFTETFEKNKKGIINDFKTKILY